MQEILRREKNIHRKVLVVDDELINRKMLGNIVGQDYDVIYAENGIQALEQIQENENTLSLIMLDLVMPRMDGYELLNILHDEPPKKKIPIIVLTSEKDAEVESLKLGAADFIPKPYNMPEVIMARVHRSIELAEDNTIIHETEYDNLTGLYTKEFFFQYGIQHDLFCPTVSMDALVLNINRFHLVNELYGRVFGNRVLRTIAEMIRELLSETDGLGCRCESDTFYIYIPHREDYEELLRQKAEKFAEQTEHSRIIIRLGIYKNVDLDIDIEQRFDRANLACSKMRNTYQSAYSFYDEQLHKKELYSEKLISEIDTAVSQNQFKVYYQPKYNIKGDKPVLSSAEALIRWFHPELGMINPGTFIPLFEENGLVHKLDRYVWNEAAAQVKRWKDKYNRTVPVSVNVSRIDLFNPDFEEEILEIVSSNGLTPQEYMLEITESAYTENSEQIIETIEKLREDGFRVEMDDFGSGYSSLNMLAALPIDAIKLDMGFIKNIDTSDKDYRMVELMIDIAKFLSVPVIAEGAETEKQYQLLKKVGCDLIQGYYFSKPLPPEEFDKLIEAEQ